jgi:hypothetical protein
LLDAAESVVLALPPDEKQEMIDCLRRELDPPGKDYEIQVIGETYQVTSLTNGWLAIHREESQRFRNKVVAVFDLINPQSALYSARLLFS